MLRVDLITEGETLMRKFQNRYWNWMYYSDPFVPTCGRDSEATCLTSSRRVLSILVSHWYMIEAKQLVWTYSQDLIGPRYLNKPFIWPTFLKKKSRQLKTIKWLVHDQKQIPGLAQTPDCISRHNTEIYCLLLWMTAKYLARIKVT